MRSLSGKSMVVIGGTGGVGRRVVEAGARDGAQVLAIARREAPLRKLAHDVPGVRILTVDATDENAPSKIFGILEPDILVITSGAFPPTAPLHEQSWKQFAVNWEADVKIAFLFCKAALSKPLTAGSSVILVASYAGLGVSPNSGGYAGAKRTQILIANYSQKESDRLGLGLRFTVLAPHIVPDTAFGRYLVGSYSSYLGMSEADFIASMASPPSATDVAAAAIRMAKNPNNSRYKVFTVSNKGLEPAFQERD